MRSSGLSCCSVSVHPTSIHRVPPARQVLSLMLPFHRGNTEAPGFLGSNPLTLSVLHTEQSPQAAVCHGGPRPPLGMAAPVSEQGLAMQSVSSESYSWLLGWWGWRQPVDCFLTPAPAGALLGVQEVRCMSSLQRWRRDLTDRPAGTCSALQTRGPFVKAAQLAILKDTEEAEDASWHGLRAHGYGTCSPCIHVPVVLPQRTVWHAGAP